MTHAESEIAAVEEYPDFPDYIQFDYQSLDEVKDDRIWQKAALIGLPFYRFSKWTGESELSKEEFERIKALVDKAHGYGKPFRFWATPDTELAWLTFAKMEGDFINTDKPAECALYFKE